MSNRSYQQNGYYYTAYEILRDKINNFIDNFNPLTLSISGTTALHGSTTIGDNSLNLLTINSNTTCNGPFDFNATVSMDGTTSDVSNTGLRVAQNVIFGTNTNNSVISRGVVNAPQFTIPYASNNALNMGSIPLILYREYSTDNANIYTNYGATGNVILTIKNVYSGPSGPASMSVIYDSSGSSMTLSYNDIVTFVKTALNAYTRIQ